MTRKGRVARTLPRVNRKSGVVNTSSVGRLGLKTLPRAEVSEPPLKRAFGERVTTKSVPGSSKVKFFNLKLIQRVASLMKVSVMFFP